MFIDVYVVCLCEARWVRTQSTVSSPRVSTWGRRPLFVHEWNRLIVS